MKEVRATSAVINSGVYEVNNPKNEIFSIKYP